MRAKAGCVGAGTMAYPHRFPTSFRRRFQVRALSDLRIVPVTVSFRLHSVLSSVSCPMHHSHVGCTTVSCRMHHVDRNSCYHTESGGSDSDVGREKPFMWFLLRYAGSVDMMVCVVRRGTTRPCVAASFPRPSSRTRGFASRRWPFTSQKGPSMPWAGTGR